MVSETSEQKIQELQMIEQRIHNLLMQKQQFQSQLLETETALKELESSKEAFKIIGNIMVKTKKEDMMKDLKEKKGMYQLRIKAIEKQETDIKEKAKTMQEEVMKEMKE